MSNVISISPFKSELIKDAYYRIYFGKAVIGTQHPTPQGFSFKKEVTNFMFSPGEISALSALINKLHEKFLER